MKENVKDKITQAALTEFDEKGYHDSSMRVIARNAGITMGNIYRYFDNKEALFSNVVGPVYDQIAGISIKIKTEIEQLNGPWEDQKALKIVEHFCKIILKAFSGYGTELLMLLDKSSGSKYENTKQELIKQLQGILEIRLIPEVKNTDKFIFYVLASAFVEGVCVVLRDNGQHDKEVIINELANIMLCQISKRI